MAGCCPSVQLVGTSGSLRQGTLLKFVLRFSPRDAIFGESTGGLRTFKRVERLRDVVDALLYAL